MNGAALLHLLQFASPALPIGGYSYSQALEAALEAGIVTDAASARAWIARHLHEVVAQWDAPLLWRLLQAHAAGDEAALAQWSERALAARDTAELRAESVQMGYSLARLLDELTLAAPEPAPARADAHADVGTRAGAPAPAREGDVALPVAYARAVAALAIPHDEALLAMLFGWAENQVLVCVKSVPLGQVAGQHMLLSLRPELEAAALHARTVDDDGMSSWSPGLSILSMRHETQHGRLYRS